MLDSIHHTLNYIFFVMSIPDLISNDIFKSYSIYKWREHILSYDRIAWVNFGKNHLHEHELQLSDYNI